MKEIHQYWKRESELCIEWLHEDGTATRQIIPIEEVERWAEEEDILLGVKDSVDYDGSHKQEVYELSFVDFYDVEMGIDDIMEYLEWAEK